MLKCLENQGHLMLLDVDPIELVKTKERLQRLGYGPEILTIRQMNFADIDQIAAEAGPFDFCVRRIWAYLLCRLTIRTGFFL